MPMGPLTLADFIGLDTCLAIMQYVLISLLFILFYFNLGCLNLYIKTPLNFSYSRVLHTQLGDSKYRPSPLLVKYVEAGWLGKKVGRGFYTY